MKPHTIDHEFGLGWENLADRKGYMMLNFLYRTKGHHKFKLGVGFPEEHMLEYRDADRRSREVHLHSRAISASYNLPLLPESAIYLEFEFRYNWVRSFQVEQWVDLDPYRYQKKFKLYHDLNRFTTNLAFNWIPRISNNFEFVLGVYPSWTYIEFPDTRQSDPLYIYPVRSRFFSGSEEVDKKHFFSLGLKFGFNWYFL